MDKVADEEADASMQELVARMRRFYDVDYAQMNSYQTLPRRRKRLSEVSAHAWEAIKSPF